MIKRSDHVTKPPKCNNIALLETIEKQVPQTTKPRADIATINNNDPLDSLTPLFERETSALNDINTLINYYINNFELFCYALIETIDCESKTKKSIIYLTINNNGFSAQINLLFQNKINEYIENNDFNKNSARKTIDKIIKALNELLKIPETNIQIDKILSYLHDLIFNKQISSKQKSHALNILGKIGESNCLHSNNENIIKIIANTKSLLNCYDVSLIASILYTISKLAKANLLNNIEVDIITTILNQTEQLMYHDNWNVKKAAMNAISEFSKAGLLQLAPKEMIQNILVQLEGRLEHTPEAIMATIAIITQLDEPVLLELVSKKMINNILTQLDKQLVHTSNAVINITAVMSALNGTILFKEIDLNLIHSIAIKTHAVLNNENLFLFEAAAKIIDTITKNL